MPSSYYVDLPPWFPDELRQSEDRLHRQYVELVNNTSALNATHVGTAASTASEIAQRAQQSRIDIQSILTRQMEELRHRVFETYSRERCTVNVTHDEWRYVPSPQTAPRTLKNIKDTHAASRMRRQSNFSKFEERVRELQSNIVRRAKLRAGTAKATRSFSAW